MKNKKIQKKKKTRKLQNKEKTWNQYKGIAIEEGPEYPGEGAARKSAAGLLHLNARYSDLKAVKI